MTSDTPRPGPAEACPSQGLPVSLTRTSRGWSVFSPAGSEDTADLVEGLSLADLVAEELGALTEPDRTARRSARGPSRAPDEESDPVDARVAALERTVAQLEHALAARVSTERAIGVLAERHGITARAAFESLRGDARSQGRPVADLAREVLDGLGAGTPAASDVDGPPSDDGATPCTRSLPAPGQRRPGEIVAAVAAPVPRAAAGAPSVGAADGRS
ncbi:MAG TPA: ANTAR domain-containing protein [Blastococcus sp.]